MKLLKGKFIFLDIAVILLCGIVVYYFLNTPPKVSKSATVNAQPTSAPVTSKVWQIAFTFHPQTQSLSVQSVTIKPGVATAITNTNSQYLLLVLDKNNQVIYKTGIPITEQIFYDIYFPPGASPSGLNQPDHLDSLVSIPYFADAQTIEVTKNNQKILEFNPPKDLSFVLPEIIKHALAATGCEMLNIVFISDGYTNMITFHNDVQRAEATFISKQPFASDSTIFDFKTVDNPTSNQLGCNQNGQLNVNCVISNTDLMKISNIVFKTYPQLPQDSTYTKIVILVDGNPQPVGGGYILGVANTLGGQYGVFQNKMYFESTATMEVLGHDVGHLYDRYLYPSNSAASQFGNSIPAPYASNCSIHPGGESFWKNAGATQGYKGCTSQYMYAPAPLDCGSQGSHSTIMSAAGCAGPQFDGVEQYYIKNQILPQYCAPKPTPTFTPVPTAATQKSSSIVSPIPTKIQSFNCQPDPNCSSSKSQQLCALKCTPQ